MQVRAYVRIVLMFGLAALAGCRSGESSYVTGESGQVYEIMERRLDVDPSDMKPAVYVVTFRVDRLDDVPELSRRAEDISKIFEAEAEKIPVERIAISAATESGSGLKVTRDSYGFRFKRTANGTWAALDSVKPNSSGTDVH
jgi:hypothetical protein